MEGHGSKVRKIFPKRPPKPKEVKKKHSVVLTGAMDFHRPLLRSHLMKIGWKVTEKVGRHTECLVRGLRHRSDAFLCFHLNVKRAL